MEQQAHENICVIVVPFPAQGHLNPMLQLSCLISSYANINPVYFVGSAIHNHQARVRLNDFNPAKIHFHDIPTPTIVPSPSPDPNSLNKFPTHLQPACDATLSLREPMAAFINDVSQRFKRVVVLNDPLMAVVVQDVASIPNAESYAINVISAISEVSLFSSFLKLPDKIKLPPFEWLTSDEFQDVMALQSKPLRFRDGDIYNTCRLIEGPYIDILERKGIARNRKSWAIGPISPADGLLLPYEGRPHECLEWLDKQEPKSVIYVSFGTTITLSDEEIKELALGLEQSKMKFIWVLRDADKCDVFDGQVRRVELPQGFEERLEGVGLVVRDWAPQPQILAHPSTGGFMSHCGWNSCLESITMGVPIAALPMHTEILKIGVVVREWKQRTEVVRASTVENVVKRLMASEEGDEIRKRAGELSAAVRRATQEGGASRLELDNFIAHITR
ncbi:hypothetical protein DH2020_027710 [Rehmannia glutinosa]|uniref:Glycosyltransferase N-terminal domain-containing protein n=1 Tax=Rehmannia glutinosa TaxID=99300 RepID=A0ABR0VV93_REHGL